MRRLKYPMVVIFSNNEFIFDSPSAVKDPKVLLEKEKSEGICSLSRDDDSTLLNPGTHSSILDENTKSESGIPEVSGTLMINYFFQTISMLLPFSYSLSTGEG